MNKRLANQLRLLGLSPTDAPSPEAWRELVAQVSREYDESERRSEEQSSRLLARQNSIQSQKMQALGEMAAGIAHEINNPLAVITGKSEQLRRMLDQGVHPPIERLRDFITKVDKNSLRIVQIIKGLRSFARDDSHGELTRVTAQSVAEDTLSLCRDRLMRGRTQFTLQLPESPLYLDARPSQISQILLNLLNNALDACEKLPAPQVTLSISSTPDQVEFRIWDNGPGVPAEVEDRIMQPFFTTKPSGKGTGLGLSISLGIAREHHGQLELDRAVSPSCFVLTLPRYSAAGNGLPTGMSSGAVA